MSGNLNRSNEYQKFCFSNKDKLIINQIINQTEINNNIIYKIIK